MKGSDLPPQLLLEILFRVGRPSGDHLTIRPRRRANGKAITLSRFILQSARLEPEAHTPNARYKKTETTALAQRKSRARDADEGLAVSIARTAVEDGEWPRLSGALRGSITGRSTRICAAYPREIAHRTRTVQRGMT